MEICYTVGGNTRYTDTNAGEYRASGSIDRHTSTSAGRYNSHMLSTGDISAQCGNDNPGNGGDSSQDTPTNNGMTLCSARSISTAYLRKRKKNIPALQTVGPNNIPTSCRNKQLATLRAAIVADIPTNVGKFT